MTDRNYTTSMALYFTGVHFDLHEIDVIKSKILMRRNIRCVQFLAGSYFIRLDLITPSVIQVKQLLDDISVFCIKGIVTKSMSLHLSEMQFSRHGRIVSMDRDEECARSEYIILVKLNCIHETTRRQMFIFALNSPLIRTCSCCLGVCDFEIQTFYCTSGQVLALCDDLERNEQNVVKSYEILTVLELLKGPLFDEAA